MQERLEKISDCDCKRFNICLRFTSCIITASMAKTLRFTSYKHVHVMQAYSSCGSSSEMRYFRIIFDVLIAGRVVVQVFIVGPVSLVRQWHVHTVVVARLHALCSPRKVHSTVVTNMIDILNGHVVWTIRFAAAWTWSKMNACTTLHSVLRTRTNIKQPFCFGILTQYEYVNLPPQKNYKLYKTTN